MFVGIAIYGAISASLAAMFVGQGSANSTVATELAGVRVELAEVRRALERVAGVVPVPGPAAEDDTEAAETERSG